MEEVLQVDALEAEDAEGGEDLEVQDLVTLCDASRLYELTAVQAVTF